MKDAIQNVRGILWTSDSFIILVWSFFVYLYVFVSESLSLSLLPSLSCKLYLKEREKSSDLIVQADNLHKVWWTWQLGEAADSHSILQIEACPHWLSVRARVAFRLEPLVRRFIISASIFLLLFHHLIIIDSLVGSAFCLGQWREKNLFPFIIIIIVV